MSDDLNGRSRPSEATREAEAAEARAPHEPDDMPTTDDEAAAERAGEATPEARAAYREAIERGARQEGEGRLP